MHPLRGTVNLVAGEGIYLDEGTGKNEEIVGVKILPYQVLVKFLVQSKLV